MTDNNAMQPTLSGAPGEDPYRTVVTVSTGLPSYSGKILGNCRLSEPIGEGGMSLVYRARHLSLNVDRVVKILRPGLHDYENAKKRLVREARLVAKLDHPHIAKVYNAGEQDGLAFIEMEYLHGKTLRAVLGKETRIDLPKALSIATQIAEALAYAHRFTDSEIPSGVAHRDVKPENIMVLGNNRVKLMDFGIAKPVESTTDTLPGSVVGTYAYMSPEQVEGGNIDFRTDIYSLAVVCYEMIAGNLPYQGSTITKLAMAITAGDITPLNVPGVPAGVRKALEQGLSRDPHRRFSSALAFAAALESASFSKKPRLHGSRWALALASGAVVLAFLFGYLLRTSSPGSKQNEAAASRPSPANRQTSTLPKNAVSPKQDSKGRVEGPPAAPHSPSIARAREPALPQKVGSVKAGEGVRTGGGAKQATAPRPAAMEPSDGALARGKLLAKEGNWAKAMEEFLKVLPPSSGGVETQYVEARLQIAKIRMNALSESDKAMAELDQLYHYFRYAEVGDLLGQCYLRKRSYASAEKVLRNALRPDAKTVSGGGIKLDVLFHLGMALEGRVLVENDKSATEQALQVWQELRESACGQGALNYCEQAQKHLARLGAQ